MSQFVSSVYDYLHHVNLTSHCLLVFVWFSFDNLSQYGVQKRVTRSGWIMKSIVLQPFCYIAGTNSSGTET